MISMSDQMTARRVGAFRETASEVLNNRKAPGRNGVEPCGYVNRVVIW